MERRKNMPLVEDDDKKKEIVKEAIDEWLDKQFAMFGRWSFYGLLSLILCGMAYFSFVYIHGLTK